MVLKNLIPALFLQVVFVAFGSVAANESTLKADFQSELNALHDQYQFPGATAAYILPDGTTGVASTGLSDVESMTAMTPQSRMLAASIGKSFVAATVLSLVEDDQLELDTRISKWLGDRMWFTRLPNHEAITLRQLLNHSSGLPNHVTMPNFEEEFSQKWSEPVNPFPPEKLVGFILDQKALFKAGEGWSYSDTGYILVGLIIETVTGRSYYQEVSQKILEPLQLTLTSPSNQPALTGLASGYLDPNKTFGLPRKTTLDNGKMAWNPAVEWTGGGLISNPLDLVTWGREIYEGRAIKGCYLEDLLSSVPIGNDESGVRYGLGVAIHEHGPMGPTYGHGGWIPGYISSLRYYPESRFAIAFQINTDTGFADNANPVSDEMEIRLARIVSTHLQK
jgi:D-alanyl-D-alanine carboxypeptidase